MIRNQSHYPPRQRYPGNGRDQAGRSGRPRDLKSATPKRSEQLPNTFRVACRRATPPRRHTANQTHELAPPHLAVPRTLGPRLLQAEISTLRPAASGNVAYRPQHQVDVAVRSKCEITQLEQIISAPPAGQGERAARGGNAGGGDQRSREHGPG
jgi:hypothetical protein